MFEDLEKIKRSQFKIFLDTTPSTDPTWKLEGWGVEEASNYWAWLEAKGLLKGIQITEKEVN